MTLDRGNSVNQAEPADRGPLLAELQHRLRAERVRLETRLDDLHPQHEPGELHAHPGEEQDDDLGVELRLGDTLEAHFHDSLAKVDAALQIIDTDQFGICTDCAQTIPVERLLIIPQTQTCVECAERASR